MSMDQAEESEEIYDMMMMMLTETGVTGSGEKDRLVRGPDASCGSVLNSRTGSALCFFWVASEALFQQKLSACK